MTRVRTLTALLGAGLLTAMSGIAAAQSATTSTQMGTPESSTTSRTINVEVVSVDGNKVVAKDAAGVAKEYTVPAGFKFQMGGRDMGVGELQPGQKVTATLTTTVTSTPVYVTEIRKGRVLHVDGNTIIVRGPSGVRKFTQAELDKRRVQLLREGQPAQVSDFRDGDVFTAVIVTDQPAQVVSDRELQAYVKDAPAKAPAAASAPAPAAASAPAPEPAAASLPKTASQVPLAGLVGGLSLAIGLGLAAFRRRSR